MKFKIIVFLTFIMNFNLYAKIQSQYIDSFKKNAIKIDLFSMYYTFFDAREQIRIGAEYERKLTKRINIYTHLDLGQYDNYQFVKIYDFFGNNGGPFSDISNVKTSGIHVLEGVNYNLYTSKNNFFRVSSGVLVDVNFFQKRIDFKSFDNKSNYITKVNQLRIGLGPELNVKFKVYKNFIFEIKNAMIFNTLTINSNHQFKKIKPFKSVWFNEQQSIWINSIFNIAYEF